MDHHSSVVVPVLAVAGSTTWGSTLNTDAAPQHHPDGRAQAHTLQPGALYCMPAGWTPPTVHSAMAAALRNGATAALGTASSAGAGGASMASNAKLGATTGSSSASAAALNASPLKKLESWMDDFHVVGAQGLSSVTDSAVTGPRSALTSKPTMTNSGDTTGGVLMSSQGGSEGVVLAAVGSKGPGPLNLATAAPAATTVDAGANSGAAGTAGAMRRANEDMAHRRALRENAQKSLETLRRQKVEQWVAVAERNNRRLKSENTALTRVAELTQEQMSHVDTRYQESIAALRSQLDFTTLFRADETSEAMNFIGSTVTAIQTRIQELRVTAVDHAESEYRAIKAAFDKQLEQRKDELQEVVEQGQNTTVEWVGKNRELQQLLETVILNTDAAYHDHKTLSGQHRQLLLANDLEADQVRLLSHQWALVSSQHSRLKDRVQDLEAQLVALRRERMAPGGHDASGDGAGGPITDAGLLSATHEATRRQPRDFDDVLGASSPLTSETEAPQDHHDQRAERYGIALVAAQRMLESEAENLKAVRHAHIEALKQRTELEVYLRQAVLRHQAYLLEAKDATRATSASALPRAARPTSSSTASQKQTAQDHQHLGMIDFADFAAEDRRLVVEGLLSVPRVLMLLYQPDVAVLGGGSTEAATTAAARRGSAQTAAMADAAAVGIDLSDVTGSDGGGAGGHHPRNVAASVKAVLVGGAQHLAPSDVEGLWERWQQWTQSANQALATPGIAASPAPQVNTA